MTDKAASPVSFDPDDWRTWPMPPKDARWSAGWIVGFDTALRMADHFHKHGEWPPTTPDITDSSGSA